MAGRLEGKVAIITGASSGLGKATALAFGREGASVVLAARRVAETEATAAAVRAAGGQALAVPTDVGDAAHVQNLIATTVREFGRVDIAFNNAGIFDPEGALHDADPAYFDRIMRVNVGGTFLCMKYELAEMVKQGRGAIVNMASSAGVVGWDEMPLYATSKHAVIGLTKSVALQYAPRGIRINVVCPAFTRIESLDAAIEADPATLDHLIATIPLGKIGVAPEVAEAVTWLASDAASQTTGQTLVIDGGQTTGLWGHAAMPILEPRWG